MSYNMISERPIISVIILYLLSYAAYLTYFLQKYFILTKAL